MTLRLRTLFLIVIGFIVFWFLYIERAILTPFILAGIFAYVLNPVVNFLSEKVHIPRTLSVVLVYIFIMTAIVFGGFALTSRVISESDELRRFVEYATKITKHEINTLPEWIRPTINQTLESIDAAKILSSSSLLAVFPEAITKLISFILFAIAGFYFLKDGRSMLDKMLLFIPSRYKIEVEILLRKINAVLGGYLRGQLFLVILMSFIFFTVLTILGVRFALILAIFTGIAEIVPYIGPVIATTIAAFVTFVSGSTPFGLSPVSDALIVVVIYFVVRQIQDYLISPAVMGRITQLHPLIILFAVLAGGHIAGILGLMLAIPVAAIIRVLIEFSFDKISEQMLAEKEEIKSA